MSKIEDIDRAAFAVIQIIKKQIPRDWVFGRALEVLETGENPKTYDEYVGILIKRAKGV